VANFNLFLKTLVLSGFFGIFALIAFNSAGFAQGTPRVQAAPPIKVEQEELDEPDPNGLVVIELFSSQACMFCPQAEAFLNTLARRNNVIALSCHVDYFDIPDVSLAKPVCTQRQSDYASTLRSGPVYTPQMVLNGEFQAIGYKKESVNKMIRSAASRRIAQIDIEKLDQEKFRLKMPEIESAAYMIWVAITERPIPRSILIGKNRGQSVLYENIVTDLTPAIEWDGAERQYDLSAPLNERKDKIAIWAQDKKTGLILAAGYFKNDIEEDGAQGRDAPQQDDADIDDLEDEAESNAEAEGAGE
jgi:hypothetical protein